MPTKSKRKLSKAVINRRKSKKAASVSRKSKKVSKKAATTTTSISKTATTTTTVSKTIVTRSPSSKKIIATKKLPPPKIASKNAIAKKKTVALVQKKKVVDARIVDVKKIAADDDNEEEEHQGKIAGGDSTTSGDEEENEKPKPDAAKVDFGPKPGDLVNKRFKIGSLLGCGGFGAVYNCLDLKTGQKYAIKAEMIKPRNGIPGLELEVTVLRKLQKSPHFPRYVDSGEYKRANYLIMQLLGQNLAQLRRFCPGQRYGLSTSLRVGLQCFEAIHYMHQKGLLHRDIKPGNYLNGIDQRDLGTIFLVDFGLVRQFTRGGKVRPKRPRAPFRGTKRYASINALKELDYGRHDDLISWIYTIVELSTGFLPWAPEPDRLKLAEAKIKGEKMLCLYVDPVFAKIYEKLRSLKYENQPDYDGYAILLHEQIQLHKFQLIDRFDWQMGFVPQTDKQDADDENILEDFNEFVADAVEKVVGVSDSIRKQFQSFDGKKTIVKKTISLQKLPAKKAYCRQALAASPDDEDYIQMEDEENEALLGQM